MRWATLVVSFLAFQGSNGVLGQILATGGGIVKAGTDLELKYVTKEPWTTCFWYWYTDINTPRYCTFSSSQSGSAPKKVCKPENVTTVIEYTGQKAEECVITIRNVTDEESQIWAVRVDAELETVKIPIVVARPIRSGEIRTQDYYEGQPGNISCVLSGGKPAPAISFVIGGLDKTKIVDNSQIQTPGEEGEYESVATFVIKPSAEDHGRKVSCKAAQVDQNNASLFKFEVNQTQLNVLFGPQPMADQKYKVEERQDVTVSFVFMANPKPEGVNWIVTQPAKDDSNKSQEVMLTPGHKDDKFIVTELLGEGDLKFRANMTIQNIQMSENNNEYRLLVTNTVGNQTYNFTLDVVKGTNGGNVNGTTTVAPEGGDESSSAGTVFAVLIVLAIIGIILVSIFIYRKKRPNNETAPLSSGRR